MQGRTHMPLGIAVALAVVPAKSLPVLTAGLGAAAIGSVLSDVDAGQSRPHKDAAVISGICLALVAVLALLEWRFRLGIAELFRRYSSSPRIVTGVLPFLAIVVFGMHRPHRSVMHSIPAWLALSACAYVILPPAAPFFAAAFASHIAADLLNRRGMQLLWPLPKRFSLGLCRSDGKVNGILCAVSTVCAAALLALRVWMLVVH